MLRAICFLAALVVCVVAADTCSKETSKSSCEAASCNWCVTIDLEFCSAEKTCKEFSNEVKSTPKYINEVKFMPGHTKKNDYTSPLPHTYISAAELPESWDWSNINGTNYLTPMRNQHIPQYCGSCWAHGALSSLADRVNIARKNKGVPVFPSIQFILNCGTSVAGSCWGGSHTGVYDFIKDRGYVPFESCLSYEACSADSDEGTCSAGNYQCSAINTCRTCSTFKSMGGFCAALNQFPNMTIAEYGELPNDEHAIMAEIYARGPVATGVNASPLLDYQGGIFNDHSQGPDIDHIVSITGWGVENGVKYWIVRNSWGEFWGEMGFFRVERGINLLGIEEMNAWATPGSWSTSNYACDEDGHNCKVKLMSEEYIDPSVIPAWHME